MSDRKKIKLPAGQSYSLFSAYLKERLLIQLRTVAFVVIYLVSFQVLILRIPPGRTALLTLSLGMTVVGLAFFLEGVKLGLMPVGELVGLRLPRKFGLPSVLLFSIILGAGATYAEPALSSLMIVCNKLQPWEAPALYHLIYVRPNLLVFAVAAGVGTATAIGIARFHLGWGLKPFVVVISSTLLLLSLAASSSDSARGLIGLAWDVGAVTTGPVTVPLVLALGLGFCRSLERGAGKLSGFGIIALGSLVPNVFVLAIGMHIASQLPGPMSRDEFFDPGRRAEAAAIIGLASPDSPLPKYSSDRRASSWGSLGILWSETAISFSSALRAVLPLAALLLLFCVFALSAVPVHGDEIALGVFLAIIGMAFLLTGNKFGLTMLGDEVGMNLPASFKMIELHGDGINIEDFDPSTVFTALKPDGSRVQFFNYYDGHELKQLPYDPSDLDPATGTYRGRLKAGPIFKSVAAGLFMVIVFAFSIGFGATFAEPSLTVMGSEVEETTVGVFKSQHLVRSVSIGVGIGLVMGVARIFWNLPLLWLLAPPYLALIPLTLISEEDFVDIAWDAAGVTTGPITVPIFLAMGLGLSNATGMTDSFGLLALASVYPILTVLASGILLRARERRALERRPASGVS